MANQSLLTYNAKVAQVEQTYYSPTAVLPITGTPISTTYVFLSRVLPWADDLNPPVPEQSQVYLRSVFANMFAAKEILSNNISPVIERNDWTSGTVYDYYRDDVDMFAKDSNGFLLKHFFVRNRYDQVFKCLWNNNGAASTNEPFFKPGNYGTNNIYQDTDGYKWKYMYTIDVGSKKTFMDSTWIPVPIGSHTPNPLQSTAARGDIEVINVINGGSGYPNDGSVQVVITGDGTGATATPNITGGILTDITVTNSGTNYTTAAISIVSSTGANASLIGPISPVGGHAFDNVSELGCSNVMLTAEFNGTEGGIIPTDIDYRQVGILINPTTKSGSPYPANGSIYSTTTDITVATGFGAFVPDEVFYQGPSLDGATFSATVLSFNSTTNVVKLINTKGIPITNLSGYGSVSRTARTVLGISQPNFVAYSGYLAAIQNRSAVTRSADGIEQFKFVLGY
jgi:hypothetical protein